MTASWQMRGEKYGKVKMDTTLNEYSPILITITRLLIDLNLLIKRNTCVDQPFEKYKQDFDPKSTAKPLHSWRYKENNILTKQDLN